MVDGQPSLIIQNVQILVVILSKNEPEIVPTQSQCMVEGNVLEMLQRRETAAFLLAQVQLVLYITLYCLIIYHFTLPRGEF